MLDLAQAQLHVPSPLHSPLVQHVEEPVASDGVDVDLAALRTNAAGLVFNECSGWGGWRGCGGTGSLDLKRPVDGFSWSPPGRALQPDTMRKLVEDVLLKSAFPELLPEGSLRSPLQKRSQKMCCKSSSKRRPGGKHIEHAATTNIEPPQVELPMSR